MERVKDISRLKISNGYVLLRLAMKDSKILTPNSIKDGGPQLNYAEVISFGGDIKDLTPGDIILDFKSSEVFEWGKSKYCIIPRMMIKFAVERINFTFDGKELKN